MCMGFGVTADGLPCLGKVVSVRCPYSKGNLGHVGHCDCLTQVVDEVALKVVHVAEQSNSSTPYG